MIYPIVVGETVSGGWIHGLLLLAIINRSFLFASGKICPKVSGLDADLTVKKIMTWWHVHLLIDELSMDHGTQSSI